LSHKPCHGGLDPPSPKKKLSLLRGLRVKPAMTESCQSFHPEKIQVQDNILPIVLTLGKVNYANIKLQKNYKIYKLKECIK